MIASNTITMAHAEASHKATPPEQHNDVKPADREKKTAPIVQIEKLQKDMDNVWSLTPRQNKTSAQTLSIWW